MNTNHIEGYIKLFRSIRKKGWYKKSDYVHLWVHLLIKATHSGIEFMFNGENISLEPGQFITGRKKLSEETGINESKIERILNFFEKNEHQIEQQKTNKNRLISILNWETYQNVEQQNEQQLNNKRTTTEQQLNTNNNDKKDNNDKKSNRSVFKKPTIEEIKQYCLERNNKISALSFHSFYESKGWMIGKNKMKDWKAAIRTWEQKQKENGKTRPSEIQKRTSKTGFTDTI